MKIISILIVAVFSFAKEPVKNESLRPTVEAPKVEHNKDLDVSQYKNIKMPEKKTPSVSCRTAGGAVYEQGSANYESCMHEAEEARIQNKDHIGNEKHGTGFKVGN
jgi:hypothetical protein